MRRRWGIAVLLLGLQPGLALGLESGRLSGFASLGAGRLEDKNLEYLGYTANDWEFEGDTVLGLQWQQDLAERLSLTVQVVSRGFNWDDTDEFEPELDWLFLRYQLNNHWRLRLGRMRTPLYLFSETLDVGYSYVWVRPPTDVYAPMTAPFTYFDGADLAYIADWNDYALDIQLLGGVMNRRSGNVEVDVDPILGGNLTLQADTLTLRYGLMMLNTDVTWDRFEEVDAAYQTAAQFLDPVFTGVTDNFQADNAWYRYQSLGLRWNLQRFTTIAEAFDLRNTEDGYDNDSQGAYLSLQYRWNKITPYAVFGYFKNSFAQSSLQTVYDSLAIWEEGQTVAFLQPQVDALDALRRETIAAIEDLNFTQHTQTIGIRYDIHPHIALKAEWQRFDYSEGSSGQLSRTSPDYPDHTSLTTFVIDVVF